MVMLRRKSSVPWSKPAFSGNFDVPMGGYTAPYVPENFQGLFIPKPGAPGILTCGYHCTSLKDHSLHCQGHSYTEDGDRVGMYPTQLGLAETGVGYTETICIVRRGKEKNPTAVRKYNNLFKQFGYQAATVDTWGGLHFLPLIMSVFLYHHERSSFVNQLDSGMFSFDKCHSTSRWKKCGFKQSLPSIHDCPYCQRQVSLHQCGPGVFISQLQSVSITLPSVRCFWIYYSHHAATYQMWTPVRYIF